MSEFWGKERILVTGGGGFLGRYIVDRLAARGVREPFVPRSRDFDLTRAEEVDRLFDAARPTLVIHLAARVGGIGANQANPGRYFYDNLMMGLLTLERARLAGVRKFVTVGTVCAYPKYAAPPFREDDLWSGYPEETNAPYGLSKKMLLVGGQAYRRQYGLSAIHLLSANLYGPGDNFDLEASHVIPALIRKCMDAVEGGAQVVTLWGDGTATREFLYADDCAEGVLLATERYDRPEPVNLGTGIEISIRDLAEAIARLTGFAGRIEWDKSRPNGQPRRCLDTSRASAKFGFRATTRLEDGLKKTVAWYVGERKTIDSDSNRRRT